MLDRISKFKKEVVGAPFGKDFVKPSPHDVICSRGKGAFNHNQHFRQIIDDHADLYSQCKTRIDKSVVVCALVQLIRERGSPKGGASFVKWCNKQKCWLEIGDTGAREKVGHALRDLISKRKSSNGSPKSEKVRLKKTVQPGGDKDVTAARCSSNSSIPRETEQKNKFEKSKIHGSNSDQQSPPDIPTSLVNMVAVDFRGSERRMSTCDIDASSLFDATELQEVLLDDMFSTLGSLDMDGFDEFLLDQQHTL